jgi:hypothetical protein
MGALTPPPPPPPQATSVASAKTVAANFSLHSKEFIL